MACKANRVLSAALVALMSSAPFAHGAALFRLASAAAVEQKTPTGQVQFSVRIERAGVAFTEQGVHRWAVAVVTDRTGREFARFALRDNGEAGDETAADGTWSARLGWLPWAGDYTWSVLVNDGSSMERLPAGTFRLTGPAGGTALPTVTPGAVTLPSAAPPQVLLDRLNQLERVVRDAGAADRATPGWLIALGTVVLLLAGYGAGHIVARRAQQPGSPALQEAQRRREPDVAPTAQSEEWGPLFASTRGVRDQMASVEQTLTAAFTRYQHLSERYLRILTGVGRVLQYGQALTTAPEHTRPFVVQLQDVLDQQGVEEWAPQVGQAAPEGCDRQLDSQASDLPPGAVVEVRRPGLRLKSSAGMVTITKPVVVVVPEPPARQRA